MPDHDDAGGGREQAEINAEKARSRRLQAEEGLERIQATAAAIEAGDKELVGEIAIELHREHAAHEARAGNVERADEALRRADRVRVRLARMLRRTRG